MVLTKLVIRELINPTKDKSLFGEIRNGVQGGSWYLQIKLFYHYTTDGESFSDQELIPTKTRGPL